MFFLWVLPWLNNSWCSYGSSKMEREMTANELADSMERLIELTTVSKVRDCDFSAIATMLRQQQAEIEQLRKIVEDTIGQAFYEDDYHKAKAEIEQLKALVISLSPNANLIYTKSKK